MKDIGVAYPLTPLFKAPFIRGRFDYTFKVFMIEYPNCDWRKYKMARLNKKRFCKQCGNEIDNSQRKIYKKTKFCSRDCVNDYQFDKRKRRNQHE